MSKRSIRAQFLAERKSLSKDRRDKLSLLVQKRFLDSELFDEAESLALYSAVHNEVTTELVGKQALAAGKKLAFPRVAGEKLEFVEINSLGDLVPGSFAVPEPLAGRRLAVANLDLVVVPGIAFDRIGHRLGYGQGYYDRALQECRADCKKVGFAYDFQIVGSLPTMQDHDRTLSVLMTEQRRLDFTT